MSETEIRIQIKGSAYIVKATEVVDVPPPPPPPPDLPEPGTAFTQIQGNTVVAPHDLYVCNPTIDTVRFERERKPGSIVLFYSVSQIMPSFGAMDPFWNGLRAVVTEKDYWHTASPPSISNRLRSSPTVWHVRPSASLAKRIADYYLANVNPYFMGTMADESNPVLPQHYLKAYRTAVEWVEADLSKIQADWVASVTTYLNTLKSAWGSAKAVVPNSAGGTYAGIDGFTVETGHITAKGAGGLDWVKGQGLQQKGYWEDSPTKFGTRPILVTWSHPDKIPGFYFGTTAGQ